jgi:hypothetical protein
MAKLLDIVNNPEPLLARLIRELKLSPREAHTVRTRVAAYRADLFARMQGANVQSKVDQREHRRMALRRLDSAASKPWQAPRATKAKWLRDLAAGGPIEDIADELISLLTGAEAARRAGTWLLDYLMEKGEPTPRVRRVFAAWDRQWAMIHGRKIRRCRLTDCTVEGGRLFAARTSEKDCPYCRRAAGHVQRWRKASRSRRKPESDSPPIRAVRSIRSTRRIVRAAEQARRARLGPSGDTPAAAQTFSVNFEGRS